MNTKLKTTKRYQQRIVVIGGNFAGLSAVKQLASLADDSLEIVLVDPSPSFNWTPNIHEILSGAKAADNVGIDREALVDKLGISFINERVSQLHASENQLLLESGNELEFDVCILACGFQSKARTAFDAGYEFRNAQDIEAINDAITTAISNKGSIAVSVIGGGFSGVEALGELLRKYGSNPNVQLKLFDSEQRLAPNLPAEVSRDILSLTVESNVEYHFNVQIESITPDQVLLANGVEYQSDVTILTIGGELPEFVQSNKHLTDNPKGVAVNPSLQSINVPHCFVAGDAANIEDKFQRLLPKQSYYAIDSGKLCANNAIRWLKGDALEDFSPRPKPVLLSFGNLNTYLISGDTVLASPLLAATKEAIYQLNMTKLSSTLPLLTQKQSLFSRLLYSTNHLLKPELRPEMLVNVLTRSRLLTHGRSSDILPLIYGVQSTIFD